VSVCERKSEPLSMIGRTFAGMYRIAAATR
jgi:hypothetical protein